MTTITVAISEDQLERLRELARQAGVTAEDIARTGLEEWLSRRRGEFEQTARRVLEKNAELYRRLA